MRRPCNHCRTLLLILLILAPGVARAADVLQEVPNDALAFVVVPHLNAVDAKVRSLSSELRNNNVFSPLAFLKAVTGVQEGLNLDGDFLLVVYPDARGDKSKLRFGVWLPVADYARFIKSIGATSIDGVAAATVAGEDLLVAHRGEWALVMDPDQRDRMAQLLAAPPAPPSQIAAWKKWIDANDVTVVAFASGVHELVSWAEEDSDNGKPGDESSDDLFGSREPRGRRNSLAATGANRPSSDGLAGALSEFRKWTAASPAILQAIQQANTIGCGIRLDATGNSTGNALATLRVALNDMPESAPNDAESVLPFRMYNNGPFVINGAGRLPKPVIVTLASAYLGRLAADLKTEEHTELDDESLQQLNEAVEQAAADVRSAVVLTQPGAQPQPVYTNNFVALRVSSASGFVGHATEVMRLWNKANRDADGETKLVFEVEETKLGSRTGTQYSLDVAAMLGAQPVLPEVRQAMEKLFGPGGKLQLWIVPADDNTVLLARATAEQVTGVLTILDRKQAVDWNRSELSNCNQLLSKESDWRVFFDPHHYYDWLRRQAMAMTGVPVIGGPLVRQFPVCPPVGIAGGFRDHELWVEVAAPAPTIKSAYSYMTIMKVRPEVRQRLQLAPRKVN